MHACTKLDTFDNVTEGNGELIPAIEAAELLGMSVNKFNRKVRAGEITEAVKAPGLRGARLFHRADIEAFLVATNDTD